MALLNSSVITLYDRVLAMDPDGRMGPIVEMLMQRNPILQHVHFREGNLTQGHQYISRTGLPSFTWRKFNEGVPSSKSRRHQHIETCGMLAGRSVIDVDLAELEGDAQAFRLDEDMANIAAFNNEVALGIFAHSNVSNPEKFMGLAPRFAATANNPAGSQIIKHTAGAAGGDQYSMWGIWWGPETVFGIFPRGSVGGISTKDRGEIDVLDASSNAYGAYVTEYKWKVGLVVRDWRQVVRICNIDVSATTGTDDTIIPAMIDGETQIFDDSNGQGHWYANRRLYALLRKQERSAVKNSTLSFEDIAGRKVLTFGGNPIDKVDALNPLESEIT
jgi:hypothetical protein